MATELRRRPVKGKGKEKEYKDPVPVEPVGDAPIAPGDEVKIVNTKRKRKLGAIFLLGGIVGVIAAGFFASSNDLIDFPEIGELSVDSLLDVLPAGLVRDVRDLVVRYNAHELASRVRVERALTMMSCYRKESATTWTPTNPSRSV